MYEDPEVSQDAFLCCSSVELANTVSIRLEMFPTFGVIPSKHRIHLQFIFQNCCFDQI